MTPFERFFAVEFERRLKAVRSEPGILSNGITIEEASWDRRAAFLLWDALGRPEYEASSRKSLKELAENIFEDLLG